MPVEPVRTPSSPTSLWPGLDDPEHSRWYAERFRAMARAGQDLLGESRLVDALAPRGARLLDAGCGPGRHGVSNADVISEFSAIGLAEPLGSEASKCRV